jgi:aminotransferase
MKNKISFRSKRVPSSGIRRFFDLVLGREDVISLGVGEPDFATPWHIREATIYALEKGYTMYTSNYGLTELREALARHLQKTYGIGYSPEDEILVTTGVSEGFDLAIRAVVDPGDVVLVHEPSYVSYKPCTLFSGGTPIVVPTHREDDFRLSADEVSRRVTSETKVLVLSYPNNPTGAVMGKKELEGIADVAVEHDLLVLSDEVYDHLTYNGKHTSFASLEGMRERTILLNGFSKAYAMTGFRLGYAGGPPELIEAMMKIHQYTMLCAPITGQFAALEALEKGEREMRRMVQEYDRRRKVIVRGFNAMGLHCFEPKGAFYAFPSVESTGLSSQAFAEGLLEEEGVAVVPGGVFGECGEGFIRCSYATGLEKIKEALERMERYVGRFI